ncbi:MAG: peptide ABC transporter substrate-binding protein [Chloroflexota bacterium]|nr:peptide ABC transporter substrate-binding protein [Chloroflexota bacterium]
MRRIDILVVVSCLMALVGLGAGMSVSAAPDRMASPPLSSLPETPARDEFREGIVGPVATLDPMFAASPAERAISALLFRGLTRAGSDGTVLPDLAERWEVGADGTVLTFHLRPDARWHDGVHVSADDVVFTYRALADPSSVGSLAAEWEDVDVRRVDRFTVELRTVAADAGSLVRTRQPILPAHLLQDVPLSDRAGHPFGRSPVGNGPFSLAAASDDEVLLERVGAPPGGISSRYGPDPLSGPPEPTPRTAPPARASLDLYRFLLYPDQATVVAAFAEGSVDAMAQPDPDELRALVEEFGVQVLAFPGTRMLALVPNLRFSTGPLRDARVRRSLSAAIDRDAIVQEVFAGSALAAQRIVSPASSLFDPASAPLPVVDPAEAQAGLVSAGWTRGGEGWTRPGSSEPVVIELLVRDEEAASHDLAVAELVAAAWRSIGLLVDVVALSPTDLVQERLRPGLFDVALLEIDLGLDPDPFALFASAEAVVGGSNVAGYQSSLVDRLLADLRSADTSDRAERFAALQAVLLREMPAIPLAYPDQVFLVRGRLRGVEPRQVAEDRDRYSDVLAWRLARPDE